MHAISTLWFIVLASAGFSQITLNTLTETPFPENRMYHMTVNDDTIVGYGVGFADTIDWQQGIILIQADSNGILLETSILVDSLGDKLSVSKSWGSIVQTSDGGYALTAATINRRSALLIKLRHNLEVEFIKEYIDTLLLSNFNYTVKETKHGYVLYGSMQKLGGQIVGFVRHVDKQGNVEWTIEYGNDALQSRVTAVDVWKDSIIIIGASKFVALNPDLNIETIEFINLDGDILKSWESGIEPETGIIRGIIPTDDDGVIAYGLYAVEWINGSTPLNQSTLTKFDAQFNIEWNRRFGEIKSINAGHILKIFEQTHDGNYIAAGEHTFKVDNVPTQLGGWLYHFAPKGDSLWYEVIKPPLPNMVGNGGYFGGVGVLSSGNVIAGGTATEWSDYTIWFVKIACSDSLFCSEPLATTNPLSLDIATLEVYPNPANGTFSISIPTDLGLSVDSEIRLFDAVGKLVRTEQLPENIRTIELNPENLSNGIYFVGLWNNGKLKTFETLVISK
jgi:hypothetical protein